MSFLHIFSAYYTVFSLAPLMVVLLAVFGMVYGKSEVARREILHQLYAFLDRSSAKAGVAQETLVRMEGERMRNSLLSAVSHDLRTPLTAIRGLAETLEVMDLPQNERTEVASAIRHQAEGLRQLVTNLLDLARMQSAGVRLDKQWHAIDEIVGSALSRLGPALSKREVRTELPSDLPLLEVDASLFERVLINLLHNTLAS